MQAIDIQDTKHVYLYYYRLHFGASKPQDPNIRTKERQDSPDEPHPSSTNPSRASNHLSHEEEETKNPDLTTLCSSPAGEISVTNTFPESDLKSKKYEETTEGAVRTGARETEGIPPSKASMSLIQSISQNVVHYNEYARSSSRNGKVSEWKRRNTYGAQLYSDDPTSLWKTHMLASPVFDLIGDENKTKGRQQNIALTPASSNDSLIGNQSKDFDVAGKVQNRSDNTDSTEADKTRDIQPENLNTEVSQSKDHVRDCEQKKTAKTLIEKVSKQENKEKAEVPPLRHSALKKIDKINTRQIMTTVTWSDKKVLPNVSVDTSHKELNQPTFMEGMPLKLNVFLAISTGLAQRPRSLSSLADADI